MTYPTTPNPPTHGGPGRPRRWEALAEAIRTAPEGEWVIVPPRDVSNASLMSMLRRGHYFPDRKLRTRSDKDGTLYVRLGGPK